MFKFLKNDRRFIKIFSLFRDEDVNFISQAQLIILVAVSLTANDMLSFIIEFIFFLNKKNDSYSSKHFKFTFSKSKFKLFLFPPNYFIIERLDKVTFLT